jgi:glucose-6-phosphate isomerase
MRGRSLDEARAITAKKGYAGRRTGTAGPPPGVSGQPALDHAGLPRADALHSGPDHRAYEHRVFVEGVILGINSFDQWGVELGKELALALQPVLEGRVGTEGKDGSTAQLVDYLTAQA